MTTRKALTVGAVLTAAAVAYALVLYPQLPERIPTHWDFSGEIDGWGHKSWAAFAGAGAMALLLGMIVALPRISPRSFAIEPFQGTFNYGMVVALAMMGYMHVLMLQAALRPEMDFIRALVVGFCVFFALLGNVLGKVRRNFWMGVRTPWTLANDEVWAATHRLAGRLLVAAGILGAAALLAGASGGTVFALLMAALLIPVVYSYFRYRDLDREGRA